MAGFCRCNIDVDTLHDHSAGVTTTQCKLLGWPIKCRGIKPWLLLSPHGPEVPLTLDDTIDVSKTNYIAHHDSNTPD